MSPVRIELIAKAKQEKVKNTFQILPICTLFVFMTCPSPAGEKTGVLILAHGSKEKKWQEAVQSKTTPGNICDPLCTNRGKAGKF